MIEYKEIWDKKNIVYKLIHHKLNPKKLIAKKTDDKNLEKKLKLNLKK